MREILLLADGDSEPYWTAAMMACAKRRLESRGEERPGATGKQKTGEEGGTPDREGKKSDRTVSIAWPPVGKDFSQLVMEAAE